MEGIWNFFFGPGLDGFRQASVALLLGTCLGVFGSLMHIIIGTYYLTVRKLLAQPGQISNEEQEMWNKVSVELDTLVAKYSITDQEKKTELAYKLANKYGYFWNEEKSCIVKGG